MTGTPHDIDLDAITPDRVIKPNRGYAWLYLFLGILALVAAGGLAMILAPESVARLHGRLTNQPLEIRSLVLAVNRQNVELPPGGTIEIHPGQRFSVAGLDTSRWRNYDLRLSSPDFEITRVTDGAEAAPLALLGGALQGPKELRLEVREGDEVRAVFNILTRFTALDFAARGDAAADPGEKADNYREALNLDPGSVHLRDKLIAALIEAGQPERAAEIYEGELVRSGPDQAILDSLLALYTGMGKNDRRLGTLSRLINLARSQGRSPAAYQLQMAQLYQATGRAAQAAEIYELLAQGAPSDQAAGHLTQLAGLYHESGQTDREITALKRLLEVSPPEQSAGIWAEIVALYDNSSDEAGRLTAWQSLAKLLPPGPNKANAYKMIAQLLYRDRKYDEARTAYQEAVKAAPEDVKARLNLARLAAATGERALYRQELTKILELTPDDLELRKELALALREDGQNAKAKAQYLEILEREPQDQVIRLTLIDFLETIKDQDELIRQYTEMMAQQPDEKVLPYNLGVLLFEKKRWPQAIEAFTKVVALDPKEAEARDYLIIAYQRTGQKREMLDEAMALYRLDPSKTVYRTLMLNTQENAKDWAGYVKTAEECAKLTPKDPAAWRLLAKGQTKTNQKPEAAQSLWRAAEVAPDKKAEAWFTAASAFSVLGKNDRALQAYKKVLEIDPKNERAAKAILDLELKAVQKK